MSMTTPKAAAARSAMPDARPSPSVGTGAIARAGAALRRPIALLSRIPHSAIALLARFSIAAVFWSSGQTKVEGFALNIVSGEFKLGWPHLAPHAVDLFRDEYKLPLLPPELAATLGATAEHVLPLLLLLGLATRLSAAGLLGMTLVIQLLVYPGAYATHGTWAALLFWLMALGPGRVSVDAWLAGRVAGR
jgi:putative oxidoreductase